MCGRYTDRFKGPVAIPALGLELHPRAPRYNIAPSQPAPVVVMEGDKAVELDATWGLLPGWAKPAMRPQINARAETVASKPFFRTSFARHRCLVPADGWYEWQVTAAGKLPHFIHRPDDSVFWFAGLWSGVQDHPSYAIITVDASEDLKWLHNRMPAVLADEALCEWLAADTTREAAQAMLQPASVNRFNAYAVTKWVNSPAHTDIRCIQPEHTA